MCVKLSSIYKEASLLIKTPFNRLKVELANRGIQNALRFTIPSCESYSNIEALLLAEDVIFSIMELDSGLLNINLNI